MSWSFSFTAKGSEIDAAGQAAFQTATDPQANQIPAEQITKGRDAMVAALSAALTVVSAGVVGDGDKTFSVGLSGHANTDHAPESGWGNDCVTISITQTTPAPDTAPTGSTAAEASANGPVSAPDAGGSGPAAPAGPGTAQAEAG